MSGISARSFLLISEIWRRTFGAAPRRSSLRPGAFPSTSPHRTRCSFFGISALPEFCPDLLECDRSEPANSFRGQAIALVNILAIPSAGKYFDDSGCFPAMPTEGVIEFGPRRIGPEPLTRTDMIGKLPAQVIVEAALRQACEELACQSAEAISSGETSNLPLDLLRVRLEQRGQARPDQGGEALDCGHLGHFAKIGPVLLFTCVAIDRGGDRGHNVHEAWMIPDLYAQAAQIAGKIGTARRERNLCQKPKGMEKRRIVGGGVKGRLCGVSGGGCHLVDVGSEPQRIDDLVPLPRLRQDAQPDVAHLASPPT